MEPERVVLQQIDDSILSLTRGVICHQVNCKGVMGAGLALAIRKKYPQVYDDYMLKHRSGALKLGEVVWTKASDTLWVASLCGQDSYGRAKGVVYTDYDAVAKCLTTVAKTNLYPIAIPIGMGSTLAGGDWQTMYDIIAKTVPNALLFNYQKPSVIDSFRGEYAFLSNFSPSPIQMLITEHQQAELARNGFHTNCLQFPTVEHYYQAMKSLDVVVWCAISKLKTPGQAKRAGYGKPFLVDGFNGYFAVRLRPDWEQAKVGVMEQGLRAKFQYPHLRNKLLATGTSRLEEGNTWNDTFWGVCNGKGENTLGKLLMMLRAELK